MAELVDQLRETMSKYYDSVFINSALQSLSGVKYRKTRVPTYLTIKVPSIKRHVCSYDGDAESYGGWILTFREIKLFKIGSHIEEVPCYKKPKKGQTIKFKRYAPLSIEEKQPLK